MNGKVLITGASGFVGYHLINAALEAGLEVHAAVRKSSVVDHLSDRNVRFVYPDFTSIEALRKDIEENGYDYIIHGAGITKARSAEEYIRVNAAYTRNLAQAAKGTRVKKFVFLSSLAALGPVPGVDDDPIDEKKYPMPVTGYGKSKLQAEQWLEESGVPAVVLRPTAVYGPRDKDIFIMFRTLSKGLEPYIGRIPQVLSFVYVKDLAEAAVDALDAHPGAYNISDGNRYDRYQLAEISKKVLGRKTFRIHVPLGIVRMIAGTMELVYAKSKNAPAINREKLNELTAAGWQCSIEKAKKEWGYAPQYNLQRGLEETLRWYQTNKWL